MSSVIMEYPQVDYDYEAIGTIWYLVGSWCDL